MTPRAVSPREMSPRDSFGRQAPVVQPTNGEAAIMAPEQQQHLAANAMSYHEGRQVDGVRGEAVDPSSARESCPDRVHGCTESEAGSEGIAGAAGAEEGNFKSTGSFGSITQETPTRVRSWTWTVPFIKEGGCCCDCVALSVLGGSPHERSAGAPETFGGFGAHQGTMFTGKSGFRPRHRRGHSTGSIVQTGKAHRRTASIAQQPVGWEREDSGSATTSAWSSGASSVLAAAAGVGTGVEEAGVSGAVRSLSGWKTEVAVEVNAVDLEFQRVLKAGIDVFKHTSANEPEQWADAVPRRLKGLLSRRCPLDDENQGLVTLFLDKSGGYLCWCTPGAAELVPDESYRLRIEDLVEVVQGDELHPRFLSLRAMGRPNPLVIEFDSDDLYDMVSQGIIHILERNHFRQTLIVDSSAIPPV